MTSNLTPDEAINHVPENKTYDKDLTNKCWRKI
jgi:hypothetical protein